MAFRDRPHRRLVAQHQLLRKALPRLRRQPRVGPGRKVWIEHAEVRPVTGRRLHHQLDSVLDKHPLPRPVDRREGVLVQRFTVAGIGGVEVDAVAGALRRAVGDAGDDHPAIGMADQDRIAQILPEQQVDDIVDMRIEIDAVMDLVGMLAHSGQRRRIDDVPPGLEQPRHWLVAPTAMPAAVDQNKCRHASLSRLNFAPPA